MKPPGNAESRRPGGSTGPQRIATAAATDSLNDQPVLSGLDRALENASPLEFGNFRALVDDWSKSGQPFMIEDPIEAAGLAIDHPNRLGAFTAALAREGVIVRVGYGKAHKSSRAGGVSAIWRRRRDGE